MILMRRPWVMSVQCGFGGLGVLLSIRWCKSAPWTPQRCCSYSNCWTFPRLLFSFSCFLADWLPLAGLLPRRLLRFRVDTACACPCLCLPS